MDIIPVLDLVRGVAVHARQGDRARYQPVESILTASTVGDPAALLRAYRRRLGATACYVADLDAIQGGAIQRALLRELAELETGFAGAILVDAGAYTPESALEVLATGASGVVIGLETLRAMPDLRRIVRQVGAARLVFSLDLLNGRPLRHPALEASLGEVTDPVELAAEAAEAGVTTMVVLDLARVGMGRGLDLGLLERLRGRFRSLRLLAGGGVRHREDLERLRDAGCDGVLVASAIHTGAITATDLAELAAEPVGAQSPSVSR
jgi:phosphoribosylformimino-5-aminoimidazole carboxamide ribotide isomerase